MKLDNEKHRKMLLDLIAGTAIAGVALDDAYELKKAIEKANIEEPKPEPQAVVTRQRPSHHKTGSHPGKIQSEVPLTPPSET
jgi:hypothetical protein